MLGSKVLASPEIGSEYEFDEFLVTVEGARSAPSDDIANVISQPTAIHLNPSKFQKHVHLPSSQQSVGLAVDDDSASDCNLKFLVAYTRSHTLSSSLMSVLTFFQTKKSKKQTLVGWHSNFSFRLRQIFSVLRRSHSSWLYHHQLFTMRRFRIGFQWIACYHQRRTS